MKTFLTLFVLLFSFSMLADDISDFQIEGMSIGDSALDYFSEEEINSGGRSNYKESDFYKIEIQRGMLMEVRFPSKIEIKSDYK